MSQSEELLLISLSLSSSISIVVPSAEGEGYVSRAQCVLYLVSRRLV